MIEKKHWKLGAAVFVVTLFLVSTVAVNAYRVTTGDVFRAESRNSGPPEDFDPDPDPDPDAPIDVYLGGELVDVDWVGSDEDEDLGDLADTLPGGSPTGLTPHALFWFGPIHRFNLQTDELQLQGLQFRAVVRPCFLPPYHDVDIWGTVTVNYDNGQTIHPYYNQNIIHIDIGQWYPGYAILYFMAAIFSGAPGVVVWGTPIPQPYDVGVYSVSIDAYYYYDGIYLGHLGGTFYD